MSGLQPFETVQRQRWLAVLARCPIGELEQVVDGLPGRPAHSCLKPAETGLVMARGRTGEHGHLFNMGEVAVSRCVVSLPGGTVGVGYVRGTDRRRAELVALLDALLQQAPFHDEVMRDLIEPACRRQETARETARQQAAATRVDFLTMVRGE